MAAAPSGASTGSREALELRDGDKSRFLGKGVAKAVAAVKRPDRSGADWQDAKDQAGIDKIMIDLDGTETNPNSARTQSWLYLWLTPKLLQLLKGMPLYEAHR